MAIRDNPNTIKRIGIRLQTIYDKTVRLLASPDADDMDVRDVDKLQKVYAILAELCRDYKH